jgi:hypothetical protein
MIQRIQSLYLLISSILLAFFFFMPYANYTVGPQDVKISLSASGLGQDGSVVENLPKLWAVLALVILSLAATLATIFLFKKRKLQARLCIFNIVLLVGLQGLLFYIVKTMEGRLMASPSYNLIFIFPLVCAILTYLAYRAIAKDEALIRSLDRLR